MPAAIDHVDMLSCSEKGGVISSLTRLAMVTGLEEGDLDYQVLWKVLHQAGIPQVPSGLDGVGFEHLVLVDRDAKILNDRQSANVTLVYATLLNNQEITNPFGIDDTGNNTAGNGILYGKMKCSIQQKPANFYWDKTVDPPVKVVPTVSHRFPKTDGRYPGETVIQGGEFQAVQTAKNFQVEGYRNTPNPGRVAKSLIAKVNSLAWNDEQPREWLCAEVAYYIMGMGTKGSKRIPRYRFSMEFQHNPDTWDATLVFLDQRTGRPPPGLVDGVGIKSIPYLEGINFDLVLNASFEGNTLILGD